MAISATLELRDGNDSLSKLKGSLMDAYTVIDLDYTLKRSFDKTHRPCSVVTLDLIKITIRGTKELHAPFHEWIQKDDKVKSGIIKIYDSAGFISSTVQDVTGGEAPLNWDVVNDLVTDEVEDATNYGMDQASHYDDTKGDIFDEMSKSDMISYIASKDLPVKVDKDDTPEIIRAKIRAYQEYNKSLEKMSLAKLEEKAGINDSKIPNYKDLSDEDKLKLCKQKLKENYSDKKYDKADQLNSTGKQGAVKAVDTLKKSTSKTASGLANAAIRTMQSARSITFENAYCVSLREHFRVDPKNTGTVDASYPWILEIGIKPSKVTFNGDNFGGATLADEVDISFFSL